MTLLRIASLNAGLLRRLWGVVEPAPAVAARAQALPEALSGLGADVIALQEVYEDAHVDLICGALASSHPFVFRSAIRRRIRLGDGLLILSNKPGTSSFMTFDAGPAEERWLACKGVLRASFAGAAPFALLNTHTTAGAATSHPESPTAEGYRSRQLAQLLAFARDASTGMTFVVGDINAGPRVSEVNYRVLVDSGWVDVFATLHPDCDDCTWDPENPLNARGPHRGCPPQRIDHFFVRQSDIDARRVALRGCHIALREPMVPGDGAARTPVSDHFAVVADFELLSVDRGDAHSHGDSPA